MLGIAAVLLGAENERRERQRAKAVMKMRREVIRDTSDPFRIGDEYFKGLYRMYPRMAMDLIGLIRDQLPVHELGVPPHLQVLAVIRFLAQGSYQKAVGNDFQHPMSQTTVSKYLHAVIPAILTLKSRFIRFPTTIQERENVQAGFEQLIGFPGVLGAIDCTLIKIVTPTDHEEAYVDRKNNHSLNVQVVCDSEYRILSSRICSGSTNDRFIWRNSKMRNYMNHLRNHEQEGPYYLIGDGGYTPSTVLLTPIRNAVRRSPQDNFNKALRRTRVKIEQTFGIVKETWRCINNARTLHYEPHFAANIIDVCFILQNFLIEERMPFNE